MVTIGPSLDITGEVACEEDLTINGRVKGPVSVRNGTVVVGEQARLQSDIRAARVVVRGAVHGAITASERIELHSSAAVSGSLSANQVVIAEAATFNGRIDMDRRTIAAKIAQYKANQAARDLRV